MTIYFMFLAAAVGWGAEIYLLNHPYLRLGTQAKIDYQHRMRAFTAYCTSLGMTPDMDTVIDNPEQHWSAGSCYRRVGADAYEEDIATFKTFGSPGYRGNGPGGPHGR